MSNSGHCAYSFDEVSSDYLGKGIVEDVWVDSRLIMHRDRPCLSSEISAPSALYKEL